MTLFNLKKTPCILFTVALVLLAVGCRKTTTSQQPTDPSLVFSLSELADTAVKPGSVPVTAELGTLKGDARIREGILIFDGSGDFAEVPSSKEFALAQGLTVEAVVKLSANKSHMFAGKVEDWLFGYNGEGRLYFNIKAKKGDWSCATESAAKIIKEGEWAHVAAVYKPNTDPLAAAKGRVEIYLNGLNVGSREMAMEPEESAGHRLSHTQ